MRLLALLVVCALVAAEDGWSVRALPLLETAQRTHTTGAAFSVLRRRGSGDLVLEDPGLCWTLRENDDQWQLLCNDHRSKFNFNPLSLRFGKRYSYRRAVKRARTNKLSPFYLFSSDQEVPPT
ncbi:unnamed protein product [Ophioblennius macclurei]